MKEIFLQISSRQDLSQDQVQAVFNRILKNEVSESQIAAFLMGLRLRGKQQMKSQVSCVPSNHMRLSCLRLSQMLCVTVELVVTSLIALTFRQLFALS